MEECKENTEADDRVDWSARPVPDGGGPTKVLMMLMVESFKVEISDNGNTSSAFSTSFCSGPTRAYAAQG